MSTPITDAMLAKLLEEYGVVGGFNAPEDWVALTKSFELAANAMEEALERLANMGEVYIPPTGWNCMKMGGHPELSDCDEVDLSEIAHAALEQYRRLKP